MTEATNLPAERDPLAMQQSQSSMFFNIAKFEHAQRIAKALVTSTMLPAHFRENLGNVLVALNLADRYNADPFMIMQKIYVIAGKPGIEAQLVIARINSTGMYDPLRWRHENVGTPQWRCTCYSKHLKSGHMLEAGLEWKTVVDEGWLGKNGSKWKTMPRIMFQYRTASIFGRMYCPEVLMGMETKDELEDYIDVSPRSNGQYTAEQETFTEPKHTPADFDRLITEASGKFDGHDRDMLANPYFLKFLEVCAKDQGITVDELKVMVCGDADGVKGFIELFWPWQRQQYRSEEKAHHPAEVKPQPPEPKSADQVPVSDVPPAEKPKPDQVEYWEERSNWINLKKAGFATAVWRGKKTGAIERLPVELQREISSKWESVYGTGDGIPPCPIVIKNEGQPETAPPSKTPDIDLPGQALGEADGANDQLVQIQADEPELYKNALANLGPDASNADLLKECNRLLDVEVDMGMGGPPAA